MFFRMYSSNLLSVFANITIASSIKGVVGHTGIKIPIKPRITKRRPKIR